MQYCYGNGNFMELDKLGRLYRNWKWDFTKYRLLCGLTFLDSTQKKGLKFSIILKHKTIQKKKNFTKTLTNGRALSIYELKSDGCSHFIYTLLVVFFLTDEDYGVSYLKCLIPIWNIN